VQSKTYIALYAFKIRIYVTISQTEGGHCFNWNFCEGILMLNFPDLTKQANLDANRVLYVIRRENALCLAQASKLTSLNRSYVANLLSRLRNEGIIQVRSVPSPFPENFSYFYASETPFLQVETRIKSDLKAWKAVFPRWATEVHDALLRQVFGLFRKLGYKGASVKGSRSRGDAGFKDKTLLSQISQGRADFDLVVESKFQKQRIIVEVKNRSTVPAQAEEVIRFGERIKHFPDYKAVFISRAFTGKALAECRRYGIRPIQIGVQVLTPHLFRTLLHLPHYSERINCNCDTWYGSAIIQWKLDDFICDFAPEPTVERYIKYFRDKWRLYYPRLVKFQAGLELWAD